MLAESERCESEKIAPPSKTHVLQWINEAQILLEDNKTIVKKSFLVTGISNALGHFEDDMVRNQQTLDEIEEIMVEVFGDEIMGHQPQQSDNESGDPFSSDSDHGC